MKNLEKNLYLSLEFKTIFKSSHLHEVCFTRVFYFLFLINKFVISFSNKWFFSDWYKKHNLKQMTTLGLLSRESSESLLVLRASFLFFYVSTECFAIINYSLYTKIILTFQTSGVAQWDHCHFVAPKPSVISVILLCYILQLVYSPL